LLGENLVFQSQLVIGNFRFRYRFRPIFRFRFWSSFWFRPKFCSEIQPKTEICIGNILAWFCQRNIIFFKQLLIKTVKKFSINQLQ
jgi:hypothetical protein